VPIFHEEFKPEVKTGMGPDCRLLARWGMSAVRVELDEVDFASHFLRLRVALVDAYVFSVFYWPVTAADVRGGGEKRAEGRGRGSVVWRTAEGMESRFFLSPGGSGGWPRPCLPGGDEA